MKPFRVLGYLIFFSSLILSTIEGGLIGLGEGFLLYILTSFLSLLGFLPILGCFINYYSSTLFYNLLVSCSKVELPLTFSLLLYYSLFLSSFFSLLMILALITKKYKGE